MSNGCYDRLLELVAENPALKAEELVEMAGSGGFETVDVRAWLESAIEAEELTQFDGKHWIVRKGKFAFD